ncbi:hypothetical protein [Pseudoruegeria sp. HB172150]|uniref:hypothetical protein n=1 Tax=Pseudoruegeria sp. HB172150 TaxID=2721164 RepID=UPI0020A69D9B|nr:hypothetical protein [Pseudoruegeria sp. HB172150]
MQKLVRFCAGGNRVFLPIARAHDCIATTGAYGAPEIDAGKFPMRNRLICLCLAAATGGVLGGPAAAQSVAYRFEWVGEGGFVMRGGLSFPADLMGSQVVLEEDVDCFVIEGERDGQPLGRWALGMLEDDTTWMLTFDPVVEEFIVYGPEAPMPQAWNMDGLGYDCGAEGFGFNIGNAAQDLCVNGELMVASQVDPRRPFPVERDDNFAFPSDACHGTMLMSSLESD